MADKTAKYRTEIQQQLLHHAAFFHFASSSFYASRAVTPEELIRALLFPQTYPYSTHIASVVAEMPSFRAYLSDITPPDHSRDLPDFFDLESRSTFRVRLTETIEKMMFVSGETSEAAPETLSMIEGIVQQQVIEMLTRSTALAARRGVRSISTDDLIFLIRHDKAKVSRLRTFLSWKDVRKNVKDSEDKAGDGGADFNADDPLPGGGAAIGPAVDTRTSKNKRAKVGLPWDVASFYSEQVPEREDEEDEDEEEMNHATLQRLKNADERTKHMTPDEYLHWSECRQASFTFRKGKRFREWAGFGTVTDSKPNDDIVDILGFLTFEIVQTLTEEALRVKAAEDLYRKEAGGEVESARRKRKREPGLFDPPEEARTPVGPKHIQEAFRRLQMPDAKSKYMSHIAGGFRKAPLKLI